MFYTLILENEACKQLNLSETANRIMFSKIEGLSPPAGTISTSSYAGMDGSYLNNAFIEKRNVVIPFEMRGPGVEARRHELYKVVKPSRYIKIYYSTENISVYAEGIVETCEVQNFEQLTTGQISIMSQNLEALGFTMVQFGQGYKDMSPPTKELMKLTLEKKIAHNGHPVLRWMMDNIFIRRDPAGNIKMDKEKSTEKIDGSVATVMALDRAIRCGCESADSVYDSREMILL